MRRRSSELSLCVESPGTGQLSGAAAQLIEDDQRVEDVLLHEEQPHVQLLEPHHMGCVWMDGRTDMQTRQGQLT